MASQRGKSEAFTKAENEVLSARFREAADRNGWTQTEAGRQVGVNQQNAGKLMAGRQGFSRQTAVQLALLCGYDGPDALLRDANVKADPADAPVGWPVRDLALGLARRLGYPDEAINMVRARYATLDFANRPARWWVEKVGQVTKDLEDEASFNADRERESGGQIKASVVVAPAKPKPKEQVARRRHR